MIKSYPTQKLLIAVAHRLEFLHGMSNKVTMSEEAGKESLEFQEYFDNATKTVPIDEISSVFGTVHFILLGFGGCIPDVPEEELDNIADSKLTWPCTEKYDSRVFTYVYWDNKLEVSVLEDLHSLYITLNLPTNVFFYDVLEIQKHECKIITNATDANLEEYFSFVGDLVMKGLANMLNFTTRNRNPKKRYGEAWALTPSFRKEEALSPPKKRICKAAAKISRVYEKLMKLASKNGRANNRAVILSAVFRFILKQLQTFKMVGDDFEVWPSTTVSFYTTQSSGNDQKVFPITVNILDNKKELYIIFRFVLTSRICVRKMIADLVPTLQENDMKKDVDRICNIEFFLREMKSNFMDSVVKKENASGLSTPRFDSNSSHGSTPSTGV